MSALPSTMYAAEGAVQYTTPYLARPMFERGDLPGWAPVFSALQTGGSGPSVEATPTASLPADGQGLIDLRGADGFALEVLGVPGSAENPFGLSIALVEPYKASQDSAPSAVKYTQIQFNAGSAGVQTIPTGGLAPGSLVGVGGITASHRYCQNFTTASASTNFVSVPNTTSSRGRLHVWCAGAQLAIVYLWRNTVAATHPTDLQAFWRPLVLAESRNSTLSV